MTGRNKISKNSSNENIKIKKKKKKKVCYANDFQMIGRWH